LPPPLPHQVGINLPIHRKRTRAGVAEARERLHSNEYALEKTQNHLRHAIHEAILRLESIEERARLYEEVIIPQAEESLASAETAYTTNRQDFLGGHQQRAPLWMRKLALEWLWRALSSPGRMVPRYLKCFAILPRQIRRALRIRRS